MRSENIFTRDLAHDGSCVTGRRARHGRTLALLVCAALAGTATQAAPTGDQCGIVDDLTFINGKILTLDAKNSIATTVRIIGNRIVAVDDRKPSSGPCNVIVDLGGRTVIPGLIDAHTHLVLMSQWPGMQIMGVENARDISALKAVIAEQARSTGKGVWLAAMGMWLQRQFAEARLPTLADLDAAAPDNPVLLYENIGGLSQTYGPAVTNSPGIKRLRAMGIPVRDDGVLVDAKGANTYNAAFNAIQQQQTPEDERRSLQSISRYMLSVGLTGWHDMHGGTNPSRNFRRFSFLDRLHGYDQLAELWRRGGSLVRTTMFVSNADRHGLENPEQLTAYFGEYDLEGQDLARLQARLDNMIQGFGDDWLKLGGQGEHIVHYPWSGPILPTYEKAVRMLAERGWTHEEHSLDSIQTTEQLDAWEKVDKDIPIRSLRWSLAHVPQLSPGNAERLAALGAGTTTTSMSYTNVIRGRTEPKPSGPMLRLMLNKGIHVGAGTDTFLGHLNPFHNIYFMTTGLAINGEPVNVAQKISRIEALRTYTLGSAWHSFDDAKLGSIEVGKLADLVVLNGDFLAVSDAQLRDLRSVMTVVDGKIMFADPGFIRCRNAGSAETWFTTRSGARCISVRP